MRKIDSSIRVSFSSINTVFFDLDGTLCDPRQGIVRCFQYALGEMRYPVPPEEQLLRYIGPPLFESLAALLGSDAALVKRAVDLYRERFVSKGMFENTIYVGIPDALQKLTECALSTPCRDVEAHSICPPDYRTLWTGKIFSQRLRQRA